MSSLKDLVTEHFGTDVDVSYKQLMSYLEELLDGHTIQKPTKEDCTTDYHQYDCFDGDTAIITLTLTIILRDGTETWVKCPFGYDVADPWSAVQRIENIVLDDNLIDEIIDGWWWRS